MGASTVEARLIHRAASSRYGGRLSSAGPVAPERCGEGEPKLTLRPIAVARGPKLLDRVREALRLRHRSVRTEKAYVGWIRQFIISNGKRHPSEMGGAEVERFLTTLAVQGGVSASTQNQALAAILFLYRDVLGIQLRWMDGIVRARRPERLPTVLSRTEVAALLGALDGRDRLMAALLYGAGLRLVECLRLRVKDVDFEKREIIVRAGKGNKDRVTMLPESCREPLIAHMRTVRQQFEADLAQDFGGVSLPDALRAKYPNAAREWPWQYVFPASRLVVERASGQFVRHHLHESIVQKGGARGDAQDRFAQAGELSHLAPFVRDPLAREWI